VHYLPCIAPLLLPLPHEKRGHAALHAGILYIFNAKGPSFIELFKKSLPSSMLLKNVHTLFYWEESNDIRDNVTHVGVHTSFKAIFFGIQGLRKVEDWASLQYVKGD
jgi:hypothetical protein